MKTQIIQLEQKDGSVIEHVIEEFAPGEFRSMPKAIYDAQQAQQNGAVTNGDN